MIHLFAERNTVKLIQHGLVEALADPIGLRTFGLGAGMINVLDREVELILVPLRVPAVFAPPVGQHAQQLDSLAIEEWKHTIIEQVGRCDRRLAVIELGESNLCVGVDEGLLVDASQPPLGCRYRRYPGRRSSQGVRSQTRHAPPFRSWLFPTQAAGPR